LVLWVLALIANQVPGLQTDVGGMATGYVLALIAGLLLLLANLVKGL
jgi:hypothetical protein